MTIISKVQQALNWATLGHFNKKEEIQDTALIAVLQSVRVMQSKSIIPDYMKKLMKGNQEEED